MNLGRPVVLLFAAATIAAAPPATTKERAIEIATQWCAEKGFPTTRSIAEAEPEAEDLRTFPRNHEGFGRARFRRALKGRRFWVVYLHPRRRGTLGADAWVFVEESSGRVLESVFGL